MQLYLIRHAQSQNNALWAATGSEKGRFADPEITEIGHQQGKLLGNFIAKSDPTVTVIQDDPHNRRGFGLTHLYCSLMTRAIQTATYIHQTTHLSLVGLDNVHEWGGIYLHDKEQGKEVGLPGPNRAYFEEKFPHLILPNYVGDEGWYTGRPYEEREQTINRAQQYLAQLLKKHGNTDDRVGVVMHGGFMHILISLIMRSEDPLNHHDAKRRKFFSHHNGAITRINMGADYNQLVYINNVSYQPAEVIT